MINRGLGSLLPYLVKERRPLYDRIINKLAAVDHTTTFRIPIWWALVMGWSVCFFR